MLDLVAAIVIRNCAVSGCHDAVTQEHGMDLTTPTKIHDAWVNKKGLDHCRNTARVRVVPGAPETSYVMTKFTAAETCELSTRMPPPPRPSLSLQEIEVIRAWIAAGARSDTPPIDSGPPTTADAGPDDNSADGTHDSANDDSGPDASDVATDAGSCLDVFGPVYKPDADDFTACTGSTPCTGLGLICFGLNCDERWECLPHYAPHPCPMNSVTYCGCDGVDFQSPDSCVDRPYAHIGSCSDTTTCDPTDLRCSQREPDCAPGMLASVVNGVYGPCVPVSSCSCEFIWECPHREKYACDRNVWHCQELPDP